jgi:hypothetical protein
MTQKDYIVIANELHKEYLAIKRVADNEEVAYGFSSACAAVAVALKSDNDRFNADKFIKAITS